jgi:hypothetical protein
VLPASFSGAVASEPFSFVLLEIGTKAVLDNWTRPARPSPKLFGKSLRDSVEGVRVDRNTDAVQYAIRSNYYVDLSRSINDGACFI